MTPTGWTFESIVKDLYVTWSDLTERGLKKKRCPADRYLFLLTVRAATKIALKRKRNAPQTPGEGWKKKILRAEKLAEGRGRDRESFGIWRINVGDSFFTSVDCECGTGHSGFLVDSEFALLLSDPRVESTTPRDKRFTFFNAEVS